MSQQRVLVVSIDGVAPRFVTPQTMPFLCELAGQGAACFNARTVFPSITLPAHASLLRGIDPEVHGIVDNTPRPLSDEWPSFLRVARQAGRTTAALLNWQQVNTLVEDDAVDVRYFLNGGYGSDDDARLAAAAQTVLADRPDVAFAYLVSPDLAGHDHGWGSPEYLDAIGTSDRALGSILAAAGEDCAVVVTTDHGGHGTDHQQSHPCDMRTFLTVRAASVEPGSTWQTASILDVAPTIAALSGFEPAPVWSGENLVGTETPFVDYLLETIASMEAHSYGEQVNMLEHSLQTAANAQADAATPAMVAAALLHDIGHVFGDAGAYGLPDHAHVGVESLQQLLPAAVIEPIRLHVDAKRYLVATEDAYHAQLSMASKESLIEQGGQFNDREVAQFVMNPWALDAVALRKYDDGGKSTTAPAVDLEHFRPLLQDLVDTQGASARSQRDRCACAECRDLASGQHLLDVTDLQGWHHIGASTLTHAEGQSHVTEVADLPDDPLVTSYWRASHIDRLMESCTGADESLDVFVQDLATYGIALARNLENQPGSVLDFASKLGHVRQTNYGALFDVVSKADPNNLAYTSLGLPLHTDNPYRDPVPGVQIVHCLSPAQSGGASLFVDGFAAADQLRERDQVAFDLLISTPVDFVFQDDHVDLRSRRPLIDQDLDGRIRAIHVNHRSMVAPQPSAQTERFYDAYAMFAALLNDPTNTIDVELRAGDVVAFDNLRVLHARSAFSGSATRHLQGCYIDMDAVRSTARRI